MQNHRTPFSIFSYSDKTGDQSVSVWCDLQKIFLYVLGSMCILRRLNGRRVSALRALGYIDYAYAVTTQVFIRFYTRVIHPVSFQPYRNSEYTFASINMWHVFVFIPLNSSSNTSIRHHASIQCISFPHRSLSTVSFLSRDHHVC